MTTDNPTIEDATQTLEEAGFKVRVRDQTVTDAAERRRRAGSAVAGGRDDALDRAAPSRSSSAAWREATPTPEPTTVAMRVAVLAGGRSSEHEVSLNSAASVREGVAAAGHEVLPVTIERSGAWAHDGEALALRPGGGLLGADAVFPVLHGPFGEDGTLQGLLELLDVPYVGAGVLASSLCMDKVVFKEVLAAADVPQVPYARRARAALARRARRRAARAGRARHARCSSSRRGSAPRSGSPRCGRRPSSAPALDAAFAHDSLVIVEGFSRRAWRSSARCSATASPRPRCRARSCSPGPTGTTTRPSTPTAGWSSSCPRGSPEPVLEEVRRLAVDTFVRVGCAGLARVDFFVEDGERVLVNELNTMPGLHRDERLPEALGGDRASPFPELCDRLLGFALERYARRALRSRVLARGDFAGRAGSRRSRRARRPAASFVIQTR